MDPCFAIIDRNTLSYVALRHVLQDMFNHVDVFAYNTIEEFIRDSNRHFVHFFVSSDILFCNVEEFDTLKSQTTILYTGSAGNIERNGFRILDVSLSEDKIVEQLKHLQNTGKYENNISPTKSADDVIQRLSQREKDVLRLIVTSGEAQSCHEGNGQNLKNLHSLSKNIIQIKLYLDKQIQYLLLCEEYKYLFATYPQLLLDMH